MLSPISKIRSTNIIALLMVGPIIYEYLSDPCGKKAA